MQYSHETLSKLLNSKDIKFLSQQGGGNSLVLCVEADDEKWAVKSYPPYAPGKRDRLLSEVLVYQFLNKNQIAAVPFLKTFCDKERCLIMSWVEGKLPSTYLAEDIEQAIQFIRSVVALNSSPEARNLPQAAEACLSLNIIISQITRRYEHLYALANEPELKKFLTQTFNPLFEQVKQHALVGYQKHQIDTHTELKEDQRSLIPADFGFHNSIRDYNGKLTFFDFDYFGWDDPVKLLADILWHPKMQLTQGQKQQFINGLTEVFSADSLFLTRFSYTQYLFGLRWVLILLNEFIPDFWQNRQHANAHQNQAEAKKIQLKRAQELLDNVSSS